MDNITPLRSIAGILENWNDGIVGTNKRFQVSVFGFQRYSPTLLTPET
jgi:hypothetical protein